MENHPIPQDVTGFQFKLIGNMTVKQFAYLAVGGIFAVILYYLPVWLILKLIFIPLFAGSGAALAFLPIDGRPLDLMLTQLIKALISPNQYVYRKTGVHFAFTNFSPATYSAPATSAVNAQHKKQAEQKKQAFNAYLTQISSTRTSATDKKESEFLSQLFSQNLSLPTTQIASPVSMQKAVTSPQDPVAPPVSLPPKPSLEEEDQKLSDTVKHMQEELTEAKAEEAHSDKPQEAHDKTMSLEHQLSEMLKQKERLEQELIKMQQATTQAKKLETYTVEAPKLKKGPLVAPIDLDNQPHVKKLLTPQEARERGILHASDTPNVLMGVVHDPRGNIMANILVELTDKDGMPIRAFKTNELGQFASATALKNGVYTLTLEDPKNTARFDTIEVVANGNILPPLDITSHDEREELRKALFN